MELNQKLSDFINSKNHTFLLYGPWGVGKSFCVDEWIKTLSSKYKCIKLSLFGLSNVDELNSLAISSESIFNKMLSKLNKLSLNTNINIDNFVSLNASLLSFILSPKHNKNKKYLFILDDIERKDNKLSIEEVFGFIERLPKENIKFILIANLDKLYDSSQFIGFKEKVIDVEFNLSNPSQNAIKSIIGVEYTDRLLNNKINIKNLRTLIKIRNIIEIFDQNINNCLFDCILYCCLNIYDNELNKDSLRNLLIKGKKTITYFINYNDKTDDEDEKISKEVDRKIKEYKEEWEFVYEIIKRENLLNLIQPDKLKKFVKEVYYIIKSNENDKLLKIDIPLIEKPLKQFNENGSVIFYSATPNKKYKEVLNNIETLFDSSEYDALSLFNMFCIIVINSKNIVSKNSRGKSIEKKIIKKCPPIIASYIFNFSDIHDDYLFSFIHLDNLPSWVENMRLEIANNYYKIINSFYLEKSRDKLFDFEEFEKKINIFQKVLRVDINYQKINVDSIILNTINKLKSKFKYDIDLNIWSYFSGIIGWVFQNKEKYNLNKTIDKIKTYAKIKGVIGYRFTLMLNKK